MRAVLSILFLVSALVGAMYSSSDNAAAGQIAAGRNFYSDPSAGARQTRTVLPPEVRAFSPGDVMRSSGRQDVSGIAQPPWTEVVINVGSFNIQPRNGASVTIVPLEVDVAPLQLKIVKVTRQRDECTGEGKISWGVELEKIRERSFWEQRAVTGRREDVPFGVLVIYPAVANARAIKRNELKTTMLPRGVKPATVNAAVDVNNDGKPDLLWVSYCCDAPTRAGNDSNCDLTCGRTYKRGSNGWKLVKTFEPC
ncbi:MAG: hypothetical protein H0V27_02495 [Pyrinomonadaceae bacterium]|nr:hypothetical protein [Pyrinomonadaceae bacterium]